MKVTVLRLGHRIARDKRISTHCALVARALGATSIIFTGERDEEILTSVSKLVENWGGKFSASYSQQWRKPIVDFKRAGGIVAHLTVYGMPYQKQIPQIRKACKSKGLMVIVGGAKVPYEVYQLADFNVSVTSQPHSEVAALAVFLHDLFEGRELDLKFPRAKIMVVPDPIRKNVKSRGKPARKI
jgi:tRNA (cytidine56-2'-O)-methyltransferase